LIIIVFVSVHTERIKVRMRGLTLSPQIRRSGRTSLRTLNPAQGLERVRDEGEVNYTGMAYSIVGM